MVLKMLLLLLVTVRLVLQAVTAEMINQRKKLVFRIATLVLCCVCLFGGLRADSIG
jgi:hypothetical protein